jgi:hypothetical protein
MFGKGKVAVLAGLSLAMSTGAVVAMEAADAKQAEPGVEEIAVIAQRSIFTLTQQVAAAEDVMYDLYNELNTNDQYDIECKMETRLFSHTKKKICLPAYARNSMLGQAQDRVRGGQGQGSMDTAVPTDVLQLAEYPELQANFQEVILQNQDLFSAVARHYELSEILRLRRKAGDDE